MLADFSLNNRAPSFKTWKFKKEAVNKKRGKNQSSVSIKFGMRAFDVEYKYNKAKNIYLRWNGGQIHKDANTKKQLFAKNIVIQYVPKEKTAYLGNPIRSRILGGNEEEAYALFSLEPHVPVILVLGGSQGAQPINIAFLQIVNELTETHQVIHQTGKDNYSDVLKQASVLMEKSPHRGRYRLFPYLNEDQLRNASRVARVVISRAGAGAIFEIAAWGIPSILIPLSHAAADHQRHNAYIYARNGACSVIEETNLTPTVLLNETRKILSDEERRSRMSVAAQKFARIDAAEKIAREIILLGLHKRSF